VSKGIFGASVGFVSSRWRLLSALNVVFFSVAFGVGLAASLVYPPPLYSGQPVYVLPQFLYGSAPLLFLSIFCFNLVVAAFCVVTLPGFLFFPLSAALMTLRAVLWGLLLGPLPPRLFLDVLPTLVLEGEAYVIAAAVGITVGYSWLTRSKELFPEPPPSRIYSPVLGDLGPNESMEPSRREFFKCALKRDMSAYALVILLLIAAAAVESATITLLKI
jgi:hypothetical protein